MIEIKIPKEINEYKEKFLFGLTVRQGKPKRSAAALSAAEFARSFPAPKTMEVLLV